MEELEKVFLDSKADEFILENFWAARSIEKEMKDFYLKSNRTVWTMLPKGLDEKTTLSFPDGYIHENHFKFEDHVQCRLDILNQHNRFEWISFDNECHSDEDMETVENLTKVFFYNETVCHWLPRDMVNKINISKVIRSVGWYPTFGIITIISDQIKENITNNHVTLVDVNNIINNIKYMAMGAYDEEGCLFVEINNS